MDAAELRQTLERYKFYHIIPLADGIATPGNPKYVPAQELCMRHLQSLDLRGKRVLDIGCRDGLFCFAAERLGAAEVIGIDNDLSKPATEFLIPYFKSRVRMAQMNVYDLTPESFGLFDVVVFPGVLYHLRYPFWGLKRIRDVLNDGAHLLIETPLFEEENGNAMLFCPVGTESPYEPTSCTFYNEKGLVDTMASYGFEKVAVEYLRRPGARGLLDSFRRLRRRLAYGLRLVFSLGTSERAPIRVVTRSLSHFVYRGYDRSTLVARYWDDTHEHHTLRGG